MALFGGAIRFFPSCETSSSTRYFLDSLTLPPSCSADTMNNFLKKIWGSSESFVFKAGAWGVALGLAVVSSSTFRNHYFPPITDYNNKEQLDAFNKKIKDSSTPIPAIEQNK